MSMKRTVLSQYQARIDRAASGSVRALETPREGWIASMRKALGMSVSQLAQRLGQKRSNIYRTERAELSETASLKTVRAAAEAMGCKFVYAIIPGDQSISGLVEAQARKKAAAIVQKAATHMALEKQSLTPEQDQAETERLTEQFIREMPADLWDDL